MKERRLEQGSITLPLLFVLLALGLTLAVEAISRRATTQRLAQTETVETLDAARKALVRFAVTNGRLPCPADGTLAAGSPNLGLEARAGNACTLTGGQGNGLLPWRTLGLAERDALDKWRAYVSYRVPATGPNSLVTDNALRTLATAVPNGPYTGRGLDLCRTGDPPTGTCVGADYVHRTTDAAGGSAFILISHGPSGLGAIRPGMVFAQRTAPNAGGLEADNMAAPGGIYFTGPTSAGIDSGAVAHFDDVVEGMSVQGLLRAAALVNAS